MAKDLENTMSGNNVYLLTTINPETTNGLIMQLTQWVNKLPIINPNQDNKKIYTPYNIIPDEIPTLNIWINCSGGNDTQTKSILSLFNIACARGVIIKTYNIGRACSNASMIAVSGTYGYRYMAQDTFILIHYGNSKYEISHPDEVEHELKDYNARLGKMYDLYQRNTKLTKKELATYFSIEGSGQLYAEQCLTKGLCDWVITNDGRFVNTVSELKKLKTR